MAFDVRSLFHGRQPPVTARLDETAGVAVSRMIAREYSQLPVVDADARVLGMISHESVLRAMVTFGCGIEKLSVRDAMYRHRAISPDAGMADLLDALRHTSALLVLDRAGLLLGIVTDFDVTAYFRADVEDRMHVADVELGLRAFVASAYGGEDAPELTEAIRSGAGREMRTPYRRALQDYLGPDTRVDEAAAAATFERYFVKPRSFGHLTLNEFIGLFTQASRWEQDFAPLFGDKREEIFRLLERVRRARNDIAHLRGLDAEQRELLRFCAEWLGRAQEARERSVAAAEPVRAEPVPGPVAAPEAEVPAAMPVDAVAQGEGVYAPLSAWLQGVDADTAEVVLPFAEIERILAVDLPSSARRHRAWWANDAKGHVQAQAWLEVGWKCSVNLSAEQARFTRTAGREDGYIEFFSELLERLRARGIGAASSPHGGSFHWITGMYAGSVRVGWLAVSFARGGRFRTELYIDGGERDANKRYFDALYARREAIERAVDGALTWERLDAQRASRVARYRPGKVTDGPQALRELQQRAVDDIEQLKRVFGAALQEVDTARETVGDTAPVAGAAGTATTGVNGATAAGTPGAEA